MQRIYLVRQDGSVSNVHMPRHLALEKLIAGEIEEVYEIPGVPETFKGVRLRERPIPMQDRIYRGSGFDSDSCLTEKDSLGNVGALGQVANDRAQDRVESWPMVHDDYALTICAGRVYDAC